MNSGHHLAGLAGLVGQVSPNLLSVPTRSRPLRHCSLLQPCDTLPRLLVPFHFFSRYSPSICWLRQKFHTPQLYAIQLLNAGTLVLLCRVGSPKTRAKITESLAASCLELQGWLVCLASSYVHFLALATKLALGNSFYQSLAMLKAGSRTTRYPTVVFFVFSHAFGVLRTPCTSGSLCCCHSPVNLICGSLESSPANHAGLASSPSMACCQQTGVFGCHLS